MIGIGVGAIGMSYSDFLKLDADAFFEITKAYYDKEEARKKEEWERTRMLASVTIQPHYKETISPRDVMRFVWDKEQDSVNREPQRRKISADEQRERMRKIAESQGLKMI